jgi:hypothetical protein
MTESNDPRDVQPAEPETPPTEDDTAGHSFGYEYARQHVSDKSRDADAWAAREALRKQAKNQERPSGR